MQENTLNEQDILIAPTKWPLPNSVKESKADIYLMENVCVPSIVTYGDLKMKNSILDSIIKSAADLLTPFKPGVVEVPSVEDAEIICEVVSSSPVRFMRYVRQRDDNDNILPHGGLAVCFEVTEESLETRQFKFSYALCGKKDLFSKKQAMAICHSRLDSSDWYSIANYNDEVSLVTNVLLAIENVLDTPISNSGGQVFNQFSPRYTKSTLAAVHDLIMNNYVPSDTKSRIAIFTKRFA
jgi:hypothetical protein